MPLYEYQCTQCNERSEILRKLGDPPYTHCPKCGGEVKKLHSSPAIQFKGSGWYVTDYAGKKSGAPDAGAADKSESKESTSEGAKDSTSKDSPTKDPSSKDSSSKESSSKESSSKDSSSKESKDKKSSKKKD